MKNGLDRHYSKANFLSHILQDSTFSQLISIPMSGLSLKTRVFAAVKATNLDRRYIIQRNICFIFYI